MGALYDAAARAEREPRTDRQAQAWERQNYFFAHYDELEAKRANGAGTDSITRQRRERGNGYLSVRDWSELDGYGFRCHTARRFADVLLSLYAFKKLHAVQGSHEGLADMMGVFGKLCCVGTMRNAIAELVPLGLKVEHYFEHHPEGFRCRTNRKNEAEEQRRLREWVEASPLYSLAPGSELALVVDKVLSRPVDKSPNPRQGNYRLPTVGNLSGSSSSENQRKKQKERADLPCGNVDIVHLPCSPIGKSEPAKERPSAAASTARPLAAPEKAAKTGGAGDSATVPANSHAKPSAVASAPRLAVAPCPAPTTPDASSQPTPARHVPEPEIVRELVALALAHGGDPAARAARLAELEALADHQAAQVAAVELANPPALPVPTLAPERLTPLQQRRRNAVVLPFVRAQRDAQKRAVVPRPLSPVELAKLDRAECLADAALRSRLRIERPSRPATVGIGDAFDGALATLQVRNEGGSKSDERAATAAVDRKRRQAMLDAIAGALDELHAAIDCARVPRARVELIDRALGNVVALYQSGQLDVGAVLSAIDVQRRTLGEIRRESDATATLDRLDEKARERAIRNTSLDGEPFDAEHTDERS